MTDTLNIIIREDANIAALAMVLEAIARRLERETTGAAKSPDASCAEADHPDTRSIPQEEGGENRGTLARS